MIAAIVCRGLGPRGSPAQVVLAGFFRPPDPSPDRTLQVPAEERSYAIAAESRRLPIAA